MLTGPTQEIRGKELDFLSAISFELNVTPEEYGSFIRALEATVVRASVAPQPS